MRKSTQRKREKRAKKKNIVPKRNQQKLSLRRERKKYTNKGVTSPSLGKNYYVVLKAKK